MKCLSRLYEILDDNGESGCSKSLLKQIYRRNGKFTMPEDIMRTNADSGPLVKHELIERNKKGKLVITDKARGMID